MFPAWLAMRWKLVAHIDSLSVVCCDQVKLLECVMRLILSTVFLIIISGNALSQQAYQCTEIQNVRIHMAVANAQPKYIQNP